MSEEILSAEAQAALDSHTNQDRRITLDWKKTVYLDHIRLWRAWTDLDVVSDFRVYFCSCHTDTVIIASYYYSGVWRRYWAACVSQEYA